MSEQMKAVRLIPAGQSLWRSRSVSFSGGAVDTGLDRCTGSSCRLGCSGTVEVRYCGSGERSPSRCVGVASMSAEDSGAGKWRRVPRRWRASSDGDLSFTCLVSLCRDRLSRRNVGPGPFTFPLVLGGWRCLRGCAPRCRRTRGYLLIRTSRRVRVGALDRRISGTLDRCARGLRLSGLCSFVGLGGRGKILFRCFREVVAFLDDSGWVEDLGGARGSGIGASMPSSGTVASSISYGAGVVRPRCLATKGGQNMRG